MDRFICALGIPQFGKTASKLVAQYFGSYINFLKSIEDQNLAELISINGIGFSMVESITQFFNIPTNLEILKTLGGNEITSGLVSVQDMPSASSNVLSGMSIVFTGSLQHLSRDEAKQLGEDNGAKVSSSVSAKTSFVVVGENAGSKLKKATDLGIKVISEEEFLNMIGRVI